MNGSHLGGGLTREPSPKDESQSKPLTNRVHPKHVVKKSEGRQPLFLLAWDCSEQTWVCQRHSWPEPCVYYLFHRGSWLTAQLEPQTLQVETFERSYQKPCACSYSTKQVLVKNRPPPSQKPSSCDRSIALWCRPCPDSGPNREEKGDQPRGLPFKTQNTKNQESGPAKNGRPHLRSFPVKASATLPTKAAMVLGWSIFQQMEFLCSLVVVLWSFGTTLLCFFRVAKSMGAKASPARPPSAKRLPDPGGPGIVG